MSNLLILVKGKTKRQIDEISTRTTSVFKDHGIVGRIDFAKFKVAATAEIKVDGSVYPSKTSYGEYMWVLGLDPKGWFGTTENNNARESLLHDLSEAAEISVFAI
jgi:hypothetical protein